MLSGAVGWVGGQRRSANIVNLQLVASLVGILLAFSFVSEVSRVELGGLACRGKQPPGLASAPAHQLCLPACLPTTLAAPLAPTLQVVRDTQIDCALAELYHRGKNTERSVAAVQQAEALQSVFMRLNEMEDHLTLVQQVRGRGWEVSVAAASMRVQGEGRRGRWQGGRQLTRARLPACPCAASAGRCQACGAAPGPAHPEKQRPQLHQARD
jgi:hypothetical protein